MASRPDGGAPLTAQAAPFFVLRRPLRQAAAGLLGDPSALQNTADPVQLRRLLASDPHLLPAVYLSSPNLYQAAMRWLALPPQRHDEVPAALTRYLLRAFSRPTPFGLFGLLSVGQLAPSTDFPPITEDGQVRLVHRLSFAVESALCRAKGQGHYTGNPTLHRRGNEFRAWACFEGDVENCAQVSCPADAQTIELFEQPCSLSLSAGDVAEQELDDLVAAGLLVRTDQHASVFRAATGPQGCGDWEGLSTLDALSLGAPDRAQRYQALDAQVASVLSRDATKRSSIDACAFTCPGQGVDPTLSSKTASRIAHAAVNLVACFGQPHRALRQLHAEFAERFSYESTPLLDLVDSELGGRFAALLSSPGPAPTRDFAAYDQYVLNEVFKAVDARSDVVRLTWEGIKGRVPAPRECKGCLVSPIAALVGTRAGADQELIQWRGMEVNSGTALLMRFEGLDATLAGKASDWREANADMNDGQAVRAEVVYVPHAKLGDVLRRQATTRYAIYLSGSRAPGGPEPIALNSLHVRLRNGRFELWCSTLARRVVPVLSVPHYYQGSQHGVYRFLCALATQELEAARLRVPESVQALHRCPRLVVEDVVFRPATWSFTLPARARERTDLSALRCLLAAHGIPRRFGWGEVDQVLAIDTDSDRELRAFLSDVADQTRITVTEVLPIAPELGPHEIVLPIRLRASEPARPLLEPLMEVVARPPRFAPGDEYVYLQLFADMERVDRLPLEIHRRLGRWLERSGLQWFYTKYSVPSLHLRFRVQLKADDARWRVVRRLCEHAQRLREERVIEGFSLTEYQPEVERYGGAARWQWSVSYFVADSTFARTVAAYAEANDLDDDHLVFAMGLSCLYVGLDFGVSLAHLAPLLRHGGSGIAETEVSLASGALLRRFRALVDSLATPQKLSPFVQMLVNAAVARSEATAAARGDLMRSFDGVLAQDWAPWLFRSHAHMSVNRLRNARMPDAEPVALSLAVRLAAVMQSRGMSVLPGIKAGRGERHHDGETRPGQCGGF